MDAWQRHLWWEEHGHWVTFMLVIVGVVTLVYALAVTLAHAL